MGGDAVIVAGFGFRRGAGLDSLRDALERACALAGVSRPFVPPALLTTPDDKAPLLAALGQALGLPVRGIEAALMTRQTPLTQSAASYRARGTGSVAEACALAGAGRGAVLLAPRALSGDKQATCALAQCETLPHPSFFSCPISPRSETP